LPGRGGFWRRPRIACSPHERRAFSALIQTLLKGAPRYAGPAWSAPHIAGGAPSAHPAAHAGYAATHYAAALAALRLIRHITCMRTTLDIDDDVLSVAKALAATENKTVGKVISELARRALIGTTPRREPKYRNGFRLLPRTGKFITAEFIDKLLGEEI